MESFYQFLVGPALWISFGILIGGLVVRANLRFNRSRQAEAQYFKRVDIGWALQALGQWFIPPKDDSSDRSPVFVTIFFVFRVCLLVVPIFLLSHNYLWEEVFGWRLPTLSAILADVLTFVVIVCAVVILIRRLAVPEIRNLTCTWDNIFLILIAAPFISGFLARHQIGGAYEVAMVLHILLSEIVMIVIPFSKLRFITAGK